MKRLCHTLKEYGGAIHYSFEKVREYAKNAQFPKFTIFESNQLKEVNLNRGIVIFHNPEDLSEIPPILSDNLTYIVEEEDKTALLVLNRLNSVTITYGMSLKATITLSSINDERAVISLQRETFDLKGQKLLPKEITAEICSKIDDNELMLIATILLISGEIEESCTIW